MTEYICVKCGYVGKRRQIKPGSTLVEVMLWTVLLIPGPFYSIWRFWARKWACPQCSDFTMFSVNSEVGKCKMAEIDADIAPEELTKIPDRWAADREKYAAEHPEEHVVVNVVRDEVLEDKLPEAKKEADIENDILQKDKERPKNQDIKDDEW